MPIALFSYGIPVIFIATLILCMTLSDAPNPASPPAADVRDGASVHNLDTLRVFNQPENIASWKRRREAIRTQILVSCGLAPMPHKPLLRAQITGKVERDGYSIEKVSFQTYEGFYLCGNLYRPTSKEFEHSKHPGILVAHGHWKEGRMADGEDGSIPARAITFARQGYVAFTYDMAGYNDTKQIEHLKYAADDEHWLWGISLMGLQTWNSIRAVDFLCSLPDVEINKIGITGESGGGTQTMMLGAIDDRIVFVAPCVMVSHSMQGGCLCENAPGLRIDFSNMDIAAAAAPKPQIMVGANGDWTKTMLTIEGPAVKSVYDLYQKPQNLQYVLFQFNHNINKTSREAVYQFLGSKVLGDLKGERFKEAPYKMEAVSDLRVFPDSVPLPPDAKSPEQLFSSLVADAKIGLASALPTENKSLIEFQKQNRLFWERTLGIEVPVKSSLLSSLKNETAHNDYSISELRIGRAEKQDSIPAKLYIPKKQSGIGIVLISPTGMKDFLNSEGEPAKLLKIAIDQGATVLLIDAFLTGSRHSSEQIKARKRPFGEFFTTYNRTDLQERLQDTITAGAYLRSLPHIQSVKLIGVRNAGLWAILASPAFDGTVADCNHFDTTTDSGLLSPEMYIPCLRKLGDFQTSALLSAPHPLMLHQTGDKFLACDAIKEVYQAIGANSLFTKHTDSLDPKAIIEWVLQAK